MDLIFTKFRPLSTLLLVMFSVESQAHVRWFVQESNNTIHFEWNWIYFLLIGFAFLYGAISFLINKKLTFLYQHKLFKPWPQKIDQWLVLAFACGITLVLISFEHIFLAPNIKLEANLERYLMIQALCGIALVSSLPLWVSGCSLLLLCVLAMEAVQLSIWIDYIAEFIAISVALIVCYHHRDWALTVLRWGLGIQLMILAIHNKLLEPALGIEFLLMHPWNFMQALGLDVFDDLLFVFSAGLAELTFGILIFLGVGTRIVLATVAVFFLLTSILLGLHELVGHIPIMVSCLVLLSEGGGFSFKEVVRNTLSAINNRYTYST